MPVIGRTKLPECFSEIAMNAVVQQEDWSLPHNLPKETVQIEKKRKDCAFLRQFDEKPSHIPGCSGTGRYRNSHSRGVCNWSARICVHLFFLTPRGDCFGVEQARAGRLWRTGAETLFAVAVSCICKCFLQWTLHWLCYAVNTCLCTKDIQCQDDEKQLALEIEVRCASCPANRIYHARHRGCHTRHRGYRAKHRSCHKRHRGYHARHRGYHARHRSYNTGHRG